MPSIFLFARKSSGVSIASARHHRLTASGLTDITRRLIEAWEASLQMAHHASAKKAIRQTERRSAVNRARLSRVRNFIKKVETAIDTGDKKVAAAALKAAQPVIHRGVRAGVLHRNTASRKLSRLSARIKTLA